MTERHTFRRAAATMETARKLHEWLASARTRPLGEAGLSVAQADEMVREMRADRDRPRIC